MPRLKAIVFDVYNTLFHNNPQLWQQTFRNICSAQGLPVDPERLWQRWRAIERGFRQRRVNLADPDAQPPFESYREAWVSTFRQVFQEMGLVGNADGATEMAIHDLGRREPFPDTFLVLDRLNGRVRLAILSNADVDFLEPLLEGHGLRSRFEFVLCSEEARSYKPDPLPFRMVLGRLGVAPQEAVQVGDTLHEDVLGAKKAGMQAAWVNRSGALADPSLPAPDYEVRSLTELLTALPL
jgi:putative hydrolase of the HAD superfamily